MTLKENYGPFKLTYKGKVANIYKYDLVPEYIVKIYSDRVSSFDRVLDCEIPKLDIARNMLTTALKSVPHTIRT